MTGKACWNCRHGGEQGTLLSPSAVVGCSCLYRAAGFPAHIYLRYRYYPRVMPSLCGHYEARAGGRCAVCGKALGPNHPEEYWVNGVFGSVACCSAHCLSAQQALCDAEEDFIVSCTPVSSDEKAGMVH